MKSKLCWEQWGLKMFLRHRRLGCSTRDKRKLLRVAIGGGENLSKQKKVA
jgi:hypothetical protein